MDKINVVVVLVFDLALMPSTLSAAKSDPGTCFVVGLPRGASEIFGWVVPPPPHGVFSAPWMPHRSAALFVFPPLHHLLVVHAFLISPLVHVYHTIQLCHFSHPHTPRKAPPTPYGGSTDSQWSFVGCMSNIPVAGIVISSKSAPVCCLLPQGTP